MNSRRATSYYEAVGQDEDLDDVCHWLLGASDVGAFMADCNNEALEFEHNNVEFLNPAGQQLVSSMEVMQKMIMTLAMMRIGGNRRVSVVSISKNNFRSRYS